MRCLALKQPYAWALVAGIKDIENRSWSTGYRGPIAILAGASKSEVNAYGKPNKLKINFPFGAVVGVVDLVDVLPLSEELEKNPWAWGPYCWRVANARMLEKPIPAKGKLKLFDLSEDLAQQVRVAIESPAKLPLSSEETAWIDVLTRHGDERLRYESIIDKYIDLKDAKNIFRLSEIAIKRWGDADTVLDRALAKFYLLDFDGALQDVDHAITLNANPDRVQSLRSFILTYKNGSSGSRVGQLWG